MYYYYLIAVLFIFSINALAEETCSRTAVVNYQEVLVDTSTNSRGEGLRYYLSKDSKAEELLNDYQEANKPSLWSTASSTVGFSLTLAGLLHSDSSESQSSARATLLQSGILISAVGYLVVKTLQYNNEKILKNAVDQHNKRNKPHIYFSPYGDNDNNLGVGVGVTQEF